MNMFFETFITLIIAVFIVGAIWLIYGRFVTPVKGGKGERLYTLVYARGRTPDLSYTVGSILWLQNSGRINMKIVIVDAGLDEESRKAAEILARDYSTVKLCKATELDEYLTAESEEECLKRTLKS